MLIKIAYVLLAVAVAAWVYLFFTTQSAEAPAPETEQNVVSETLPVANEMQLETEVAVEEEMENTENETSAGGNDFGMELPIPDKEY